MEIFFKKNKNNSLILLFYSLLAIIVLAPLTSNISHPSGDFLSHLSGMAQANLAMVEGQFPIRVAPTMTHEFNYPLFQFYSQLPYLIGGLLFF